MPLSCTVAPMASVQTCWTKDLAVLSFAWIAVRLAHLTEHLSNDHYLAGILQTLTDSGSSF